MWKNFVSSARRQAPTLFHQTETGSTDPWTYIYCQILALQTKSHLAPVSDYTLYSGGAHKISSQTSQMQIFVSAKCKIEDLKIGSGAHGRIFIGENAQVRNVIVNSPKTDSTLIIGPNVEISNSIIQYSGEKNYAIICSSSTMTKSNLYIGENDSYILIGDDCMFSNDVSMRTSDSHGIYDKESRQRINFATPIVLSNHVWVGRHACINKGTWVGENTVIGQHSVASGTLEPEAIYAGVPAKLLRSGVNWDRKIAHTLDEAQVVSPVQTRHKNHLKTIKRLEELGSEPLDQLDTASAISIILASRRSPLGLDGLYREAASLTSLGS